MSIADKLGIVITTYNRATHLERTLTTLLADDSPVKDCQITVQSNHSSDETPDVVRKLQTSHSNLCYRENPYNLGISGNICKAMDFADKEYHWNLCDDDRFDWAGWDEVEKAIMEKVPVICASNYMIPEGHRTDVAYQLGQMGFVPAVIIRTELYTDTTIRNSFDNIFTLFPHLVPIVSFLNAGGKVHVISREVVTNGMEQGTDCSYLRGARPDIIFHRSRTMTWMVGYSNILANLTDRKLARRCFHTVIAGDHSFRSGYYAFLSQCLFTFRGRENRMQLEDLMSQCGFFLRVALWLVRLVQNSPLFFPLKYLRDLKCRRAESRFAK
ncbi:MAG: glycosyltransferase family 2 protein [Kiritimatiellae bacterium]|nr:glycosyltransferase family 2 protein [Kiritimatiellia bacterium]